MCYEVDLEDSGVMCCGLAVTVTPWRKDYTSLPAVY